MPVILAKRPRKKYTIIFNNYFLTNLIHLFFLYKNPYVVATAGAWVL